MNLPDGFLDCMKETLKKDFDEYLKYLEQPAFRGLRVNTLKADLKSVLEKLPFKTKETPFCKEGFYIDNDIKGLGNHPFHHAGAFYLQEPSAMSAVEALGVEKGDKVLDLCAAPGGKSTQIAAKLKNTGLLWANEYVASRAKILASNIERCSVKNAVVSNADTGLIAENLKGYFDKVLVDAPCSGEGMVRREPNIYTEWKRENREFCAKRQIEILDNASVCLKQNGVLVYSTCTLSLEENEKTVEAFLSRHPDFELVEIEQKFGRDGYTYHTDNKEFAKTRRILFADGGEGHFVAKFIKNYDEICNVKEFDFDFKRLDVVDDFFKENFNYSPEKYYFNQNCVYILPKIYPKTNKIRIVKAGIKVGEIKGKRFVPSHDLYISSDKSQAKQVLDLTLDDKRVYDFLHGAEIDCDLNGYVLVLVEGIALGFGKASNKKLKNHYPKGLRIF